MIPTGFGLGLDLCVVLNMWMLSNWDLWAVEMQKMKNAMEIQYKPLSALCCSPSSSCLCFLVGSDMKCGTFAPDSTTSEDHAVYFFAKYSKDLLVEVGVHFVQIYSR